MDNILPQLQLALARVITSLPAAIAIIIGAFILHFVLNRGLKLLADRTRLEHRDVAPFLKIGDWIITGATLVLLLGVFGFNLGGLWTMLTTVLAMVAIGFIAVWSVLSNWLCTLVILITRPFDIGDEVEFVGEEVRGRVVNLNFIFTTLQTEDSGVMQIPNNLFFQRVMKRRAPTLRSAHSLAEQLNKTDHARI
ncbi:mechanosensitive ion channel family protein [Rariglobus hedericola]|uniref:Mechanosensitive ion channel family protein n=1 Tax=Rariglobus hedericola TaxID=2597822 RepID=A0A556QKM9_9BACT|nr:mechanosensitive ion channel family protein [Rariglobus hedericola]TSJ77189.1 mechanosensitive ion channel family protein [Rariglobus hedericola]